MDGKKIGEEMHKAHAAVYGENHRKGSLFAGGNVGMAFLAGAINNLAENLPKTKEVELVIDGRYVRLKEMCAELVKKYPEYPNEVEFAMGIRDIIYDMKAVLEELR